MHVVHFDTEGYRHLFICLAYMLQRARVLRALPAGRGQLGCCVAGSTEEMRCAEACGGGAGLCYTAAGAQLLQF
eukprot:SAG25_NODE_1092_length_4032_cov_2.125826_1_plen_73_part_10